LGQILYGHTEKGIISNKLPICMLTSSLIARIGP